MRTKKHLSCLAAEEKEVKVDDTVKLFTGHGDVSQFS